MNRRTLTAALVSSLAGIARPARAASAMTGPFDPMLEPWRRADSQHSVDAQVSAAEPSTATLGSDAVSGDLEITSREALSASAPESVWPAQAFPHWLDEAQPRLRRRVQILDRIDDALKFSFDVGSPDLRAYLYEHDLVVVAFHHGAWWDSLIWLDVYPERSADGWICSDCEGDRATFATREALWRDHLFEPLLEWVNRQLAPATALAFFGDEVSCSQAKLMGPSDPHSGAVRVLSLA